MSGGIEEARGRRVIIRFDGSCCIHSRNCVLDRPDVFVPNVQGEWIFPDRATPEEALEIARNCPSGAIRVERIDGGPEEGPPVVNTVRIRENGPLAFHAPLTLAGEAIGFRATLCRCGASNNKPYCDGSHAGAGFLATGEPPVAGSAPLPARDGALSILPTPNGPLKVAGSLEIVSGTGHTINRTTETFLCRCGQSNNKPYCDGSHKKSGFQAP